MKEPIAVTPIQLVTGTERLKAAFAKYHHSIADDVKDKNCFEALIPEIVTPYFVSLYGNTSQGVAVREITKYVEGLIPTIEVPDTYEATDENGKIVKLPKLDAANRPVYHKKPAFAMVKGYDRIQKLVNDCFVSYTVYWDARAFVEKNISTIDEPLFDKMNDYLWRNIMAVVYPEDVKREFKHLCITIKRKLYFLGDRDEVHNQTTFGLYDCDIGGTGKSTLMRAFAKAFSNGSPFLPSTWKELFGFNLASADKYGVVFVDEDPPSEKSWKDQVKQFIDSESRTVEGKFLNATQVNNLMTLVITANHKISSRLFEDEARGQRRDACFEVFGLVQQYREEDMVLWFQRMFAACPIDDDQKTYRHHNPHSMEVTDAESRVLQKIFDKMTCGSTITRKWKLHELKDFLEISSSDKPMWFALRAILKVPEYFNEFQDHDRSRYYEANLDAIEKKVRAELHANAATWTRDWRDKRPYIDVESTFEKLKTDKEYDTTKPITYSIGKDE